MVDIRSVELEVEEPKLPRKRKCRNFMNMEMLDNIYTITVRTCMNKRTLKLWTLL